MLALVAVLVAAAPVLAIDCSAALLKDYLLDLLKGSHQVVVKTSTPPSETTMTWHVNMCGALKVDGCPADANVCGVQEVTLPGAKPVRTQVIVFLGAEPEVKPYANATEGVELVYAHQKWGSEEVSALLKFSCLLDSSDDAFAVETSDGRNVVLAYLGKAGCLKSASPLPLPSKPHESDGLWGWFTWMFITAVLLLSGYIIFGAFIQYLQTREVRLDELVTVLAENAKAVPAFLGEVVGRITGDQGGSTNRSGYSAV